MTIFIYLDESGDLGWQLTQRYRHGGSSQFLTIGALVTPGAKRHIPKRCVRKLYQHYGWDSDEEKKWSRMIDAERERFARAACGLARAHQDIRYLLITVRKANVQQHIRQDPNKLYNYMIGLLLLDEMAKHNNVTFVPDPRSIKVKSGNSLHDYLQTKLWFDLNVPTLLKTCPADSQSNKNVQFADMLSGLVQAHIEDGRSPPWNALNHYLHCKQLFFLGSHQAMERLPPASSEQPSGVVRLLAQSQGRATGGSFGALHRHSAN